MNINDVCPGDLNKVAELLDSSEIRIINLGLNLFAETYKQNGMVVIHIDWQPLAGGDNELIDMLSDLNDLS